MLGHLSSSQCLPSPHALPESPHTGVRVLSNLTAKPPLCITVSKEAMQTEHETAVCTPSTDAPQKTHKTIMAACNAMLLATDLCHEGMQHHCRRWFLSTVPARATTGAKPMPQQSISCIAAHAMSQCCTNTNRCICRACGRVHVHHH